MTEEKNSLPKIPKSWIWTKLGDVCRTTSGGTPSRKNKDYYGGNIPWLKSGELNNKIIISTKEHITKEGLLNSNAKIFPKETLLIALYGATTGKLGILGLDAATNQAICAIFPFTGISQKFIFWYLTKYRSELLNDRYGGAQPNISQQILKNITFPIVPIPEQGRIVSKLEELFTSIDAGVKSLQNIKVQLRLYRQAVLKHAFNGKLTEDWRSAHKDRIEPTSELLDRIRKERKKKEKGKYQEPPKLDTSDLPNLPESWTWTRIEDISAKVQYGYTAKSSGESIGPKMLRITDIQDGVVDWSSVPYCAIDEKKKHDYLLKEGDLVFARTGATVGKSFLIEGKIPETVFASYLIRIIFSNMISKKYVYAFFQSLMYWSQISEGKIGIGQPNVNSTKLKKIYLPIPSLVEQHKIVEEVDSIFSVTDEIENVVKQSLNQSERLHQSILKTAFEGRLVAQDPTDEPAEKLLQRIRKCSNQNKVTTKRKNIIQKQRRLKPHVK